MDKNKVLSLSSNADALTAREDILRRGGLSVTSVMTPMQARFEIEMGRCGVFLICYRISRAAANELASFFRHMCPQGRIVFITDSMSDDATVVPVETDAKVAEPRQSELLVSTIKRDDIKPGKVAA